MNKRKYKRLLMVLFFPLLILGIIFAEIVYHNSGEKYMSLLCGKLFCRQVSSDNSEASYYRMPDQHATWFSISGLDKGGRVNRFVYPEALGMVIDVEILEVERFYSVESSIAPYPGQRTKLFLGRPYSDGVSFIQCENLQIGDLRDEYSSVCEVGGADGYIVYRVSGSSRDNIDKLLRNIKSELDSREFWWGIYQMVMYPIFIYLFLFVSLCVWVFRRAVSFVQNG